MRAEARLGIEPHSRLEGRIRPQYLLGEYELAAFSAMRDVEIRVRELGQFDDETLGVNLMRTAFRASPPTGPLADPAQLAAERQGTSDLFAGAIAVFKNPASHLQVNFDAPTIAAEIVLLADLLLRMLDAVETRLTGTLASKGGAT